jgi:hypothetical protein
MSNVVPIRRGIVVPSQPRPTQGDCATLASYAELVGGMGKAQLLQEMVGFQEERSRLGGLTDEMIPRGIVLFSRIRQTAETLELRLLAGSYTRHLACELQSRGTS